MNEQELSQSSTEAAATRMRHVEWREWWLWGFAVTVTLVLTLGIVSLTFPGSHLQGDNSYWVDLKEWVRGVAYLVLLFDIYTVYQHLQLQRIRRQLAERDQLFQLITENVSRHDCRLSTGVAIGSTTVLPTRRYLGIRRRN